MQQMSMTTPRRKSWLTIKEDDSNVVKLPVEGRLRFYHQTTTKAEFDEMNGWPILKALAPIILYFRPFCVVELGAGESTPILAEAAERMNVKMYSCDILEEKRVEYFEGHKYYKMISEEFMEQFDDMPAIVFIDADHAYEMVWREFMFFYKRLVTNGVIFMHDTLPPHELFLSEASCHTSYKVRQNIEKYREELDCDVFTWPYTAIFCGLTMVMKKDPERPDFAF